MLKNKFRFYDLVNNMWLEHNAISADIFAVYDNSKVYAFPNEKHIVVMQDSTLKDKKGFDLFQGDFVSYENIIYTVKLKNAMFCLEKDSIQIPLYQCNSECLKLGNIFDNSLGDFA